MKTKAFSLTAIVFGFLLFGCNQAETDNNRNDAVTNSADNQSEEKEIYDNEEQLDSNVIADIQKTITLFKEKNVEKIAEIINYPLEREYPIPSIKNKDEFKKRFSEVFDQILIEKIANSKIQQWSELGARGIMFEDGVLWMGNSDGMITAVNYQSEFEKKSIMDLTDGQKGELHSSLQTFVSPTYKIKTKNYLIRIDEINNAKFRYASWKIGKKESSKPDLIVENGEFESQGTGGNHLITFEKDQYKYKVYRNIIGKSASPEITLEVEKDGKTILKEDGSLITE